MSGDVQPRKRKDKKRRKDEGDQVPIQTHTPLSTNPSNDDLNIHVHKEGGTGGGICAKLVFFVLLSALAVVIGMIITEYRGLTDIDTVDTESRFSQIFEGWTDASPDHHDGHNIEQILEDRDGDHEDEDNISAGEDDEHEPSEEEEDDENDGSEVSEEKYEDDNDEAEEDEEQEDETLEESQENEVDEEDDVQASDEDEEEKETYDVESEEADEDEQDHDEDEQELENIDSEEEQNVDDDDEDDEEPADEEEDESVETKSEEQDEDDHKEDDKADEDDADKSDEKEPGPPIKIKKIKDVGDKEAPADGKPQESSGSAVDLVEPEDSDSDKQSDDAGGYEYSNITNKDDDKIKGQIDEAQKEVQND